MTTRTAAALRRYQDATSPAEAAQRFSALTTALAQQLKLERTDARRVALVVVRQAR